MSGKPGSTNDGGPLDAVRREVLARRLRGDTAQSAPVVTIVQLPPETPVAATAAQAQLLFLDEFHADSAAYHISVALDSVPV